MPALFDGDIDEGATDHLVGMARSTAYRGIAKLRRAGMESPHLVVAPRGGYYIQYINPSSGTLREAKSSPMVDMIVAVAGVHKKVSK